MTTPSFRGFLPFRTKKYKPLTQEIEPRAGLEPLDDPFEQPYDFPDKPPKTDVLPEFHHSNMTFWWFIFGAIFITFFLFTVEYHTFGVPSCWYKNLKKYPFSPDPNTIMFGNAFLAFMLAWAGYQIFKQNNMKIVRYGGIFLMVGTYLMMLIAWLMLYDSRRPRIAMLFLVFALVMVAGFIVLSLWSQSDYEILLPLTLALLWLLYLMYYVTGIVNENDDCLFGNFDDIYGPDDELDPKNPKNCHRSNLNRKIHHKKR